jgi:hypothetical protein
MKRVFALAALATLAFAGSGLTSSEAEARGWRGHHHHARFGFVRVVPVYPVYSGYCRVRLTPYGYVRRCVY